MAMEGKDWWSSKTVWAQIVSTVAGLTAAFGVDLGLDPETQAAIVIVISAIVNVAIRFRTKRPIR